MTMMFVYDFDLLSSPTLQVSSTQLSVTGCLCEDYFRIREIVYEQFNKEYVSATL
jgi:hypothetical protein